jgi:hypothetical protein
VAAIARKDHAAATLADGRVLIAVVTMACRISRPRKSSIRSPAPDSTTIQYQFGLK